MPRTSPQIKVTEISGNQFPDLNAARQSARALLASSLADVMRRMIDQGTLEIKDGHIRPRDT